ncbi:MAG: tetratricopeptide repeat protein [Patescibacteria group bacterium]|jgi:tetratricopeptide (TPR) repeat protein
MTDFIRKRWPKIVVAVIFVVLAGTFLWKSNIKEGQLEWGSVEGLNLTDQQKQQYEETVKKLEDSNGDKKNPTALSDLARLRDQGGDPEGSIKIYQKALAEEPDNTLVLYNLADVYYSIGDYGKTEEMYRRIINNHPLEMPVYRRLFDLYRDKIKTKYPSVLEILLRGWQYNSDRPAEFIKMLALYYSDMGDIETAKQYYQQLLIIEPNNQDARDQLKRLGGK